MKKPELIVLQDSREQTPLRFEGYQVEIVALKVGDYSCRIGDLDLRDRVSIERKSIGDLLQCVGQERDRFERCLERLALIPWRSLVIEGDLERIAAGTRHSTLTPPQIMGSLTAWATRYSIPVWPAPNRDWAAAIVRVILTHAARWALEEKP